MKISVPSCEVTIITKINNLVTQNTKKMAERFPDFEILEIQELEENSEKQNTKSWCSV